jgi:hypothetical protein
MVWKHMEKKSEHDCLFRRQYASVCSSHPEWPEEKKQWVARRRVYWTKQVLGMDREESQ